MSSAHAQAWLSAGMGASATVACSGHRASLVSRFGRSLRGGSANAGEVDLLALDRQCHGPRPKGATDDRPIGAT